MRKKEGLHTSLPDVLNPDIGARREKQPLYGNEQVARHVRGDRHTDKEYGERLRTKRTRKRQITTVINYSLYGNYQS